MSDERAGNREPVSARRSFTPSFNPIQVANPVPRMQKAWGPAILRAFYAGEFSGVQVCFKGS